MPFGDIRDLKTGQESIHTRVHKVVMPDGVQPGDLLLLFLAFDNYPETTTTPPVVAGFDYLTSGYSTGNDRHELTAFSRRANGCEEASIRIETQQYRKLSYAIYAIPGVKVHQFAFGLNSAQDPSTGWRTNTAQMVTIIPGEEYQIIAASKSNATIDSLVSSTWPLTIEDNTGFGTGLKFGTHYSSNLGNNLPQSQFVWDYGANARQIAVAVKVDDTPPSYGRYNAQSYDPGHECSCCDQAEKCECREGRGGSLRPNKDLKITITGSFQNDTDADGACLGPCLDIAGTYQIACGETLDIELTGPPCETTGSGLYPDGVQERHWVRITYNSESWGYQYDGRFGGALAVRSARQQYLFINGEFVWTSFCLYSKRFTRGFKYSNSQPFPVEDLCSDIEPAGFAQNVYDCNGFFPACNGLNIDATFELVDP